MSTPPFRRSLAAVVLTAAGYAALTTNVLPALAADAKDMFVTNDTAHPVPTAAQGTTNVKVDDATPVKVQTVGGGPAAIERVEKTANFISNEKGVDHVILTVPAGKRFVGDVASATASCACQPTDANAALSVEHGSQVTFLSFPFGETSTISGVFAAAGDTISAHSEGRDVGTFRFTVVGHYEPLP